MARIETEEQLRTLYAAPKGRPVTKQLDHLEKHCRRFISLSPFLVLSTGSAGHSMDASPRGEDPGFVKVLDGHRLAIPDRPGNNRMDSFTNVLKSPNIGILFLIPGVDETLRVNGSAEIRDDEDLIDLFETSGKKPKSVLLVHVKEAYLHCAKALMRSRLWSEEAKILRDQLPSMSQMINEQTKSSLPLESQEEMKARYEKVLY